MLIQVVATLLLVGLSIGGPLSRKEIAKPRADGVDYRLPSNIVPSQYTLKLIPDFEKANFTGSVQIKIKVVSENTNNITLHYKDLDIKTADIKITEYESKKDTVVKNITNGPTPEHEFLIINLEAPLEKEKTYTLDFVKFAGVLNSNNKGFYLAEFKDKTGKAHKFATTQFEPTSARRAFPCFDEPAIKATFKISLTKPNDGFVSISNMPVVKSFRATRDSYAVTEEFEETHLMSTYLIAFVVSEMKLSTKGIHRVLAKPQSIEDKTEQYALDTGTKILNEIGNFVDVKYSLPKMDQAAIPDKYFSAGAMENWGLVTYRETYLLKSDEVTTTSMNQQIATIIAHEFGHQWFGNLVSPKWWKYIWLNEGFATYFEHLGASLVETKWRIMDQFVVKNTQYSFGPDSLDNTRAMNHDAGTPDEISSLFDRVAYEKSGSVIRMLEGFLTTDVFKLGLKYYLEKKGNNSAEPADLYDELKKAADEKKIELPVPLSKIMESWDSQKGFPVLDITRNYTEADQTKIFVNQSRFFLEHSTSDDKSFWIVPLNFVTNKTADFNNTNVEQWLTKKEETLTVAELRSEDWLIINKQETGYYRVNYDEVNWKKIIDALVVDHNKIHLLNRAQLIDDSFNLARSGRLSYEIPFQLSVYLSKETDYIPLYSFFTAASFLHTMLSGSPTHFGFKTHVVALLQTAHEKLGYDENKDDEHLDKLNRASIQKWLCDMGNSECRATALIKLRNWKDDPTKTIPLDLQAPVYCGAMRIATQEDWDFLYTQYKAVHTNDDTALHSRIRSALGCPDNTTILENFINNTVADGSIISPENAFAAIYNSGSLGAIFAFEHVVKHFDDLHKKLEDRMRGILNGIGSKLTTNEQLTKLKELSEAHTEQKDLFTSAIANTEKNVNWNEKYLSGISTWFDKYYSGSGTILGRFPASFIVIISYVLYKYVS